MLQIVYNSALIETQDNKDRTFWYSAFYNWQELDVTTLEPRGCGGSEPADLIRNAEVRICRLSQPVRSLWAMFRSQKFARHSPSRAFRWEHGSRL
jgi:hypothetical protein